MEGLHEMDPPLFFIKTFDMMENSSTDTIVFWSSASNCFIVWVFWSFAQIFPIKIAT